MVTFIKDGSSLIGNNKKSMNSRIGEKGKICYKIVNYDSSFYGQKVKYDPGNYMSIAKNSPVIASHNTKKIIDRAFDSWSEFVNIDFNQCESKTNMIYVGLSNFSRNNKFIGISQPISLDQKTNAIVINERTLPQSKYQSDLYLSNLIHEIGHALGLKHPFEGYTRLPKDHDSVYYTAMSYSYPNFNGLRLMPSTPMYYDVKAIEKLYGYKASNLGNNNYTFNENATGYTMIKDDGGLDKFDFSKIDRDIKIDLRYGPDHKSEILPYNVFYLYDNTKIEQIILGNGNDELITNNYDTEIFINKGNNKIKLGGGKNKLIFNKNSKGTNIVENFRANHDKIDFNDGSKNDVFIQNHSYKTGRDLIVKLDNNLFVKILGCIECNNDNIF